MPRNRILVRRSAFSALGLVLIISAGTAGAGHAQRIASFDAEKGQVTEGVTSAPDGTVYVSLSWLGQLARVPAGGGEPEMIATLDGLAEGDIGLLGLEWNDGDVYGAAFSTNPDVSGVWRFDGETGEAARIMGSENIALPNEVTFADDGTMYISDTVAGAVYRVPAGADAAELWLQDPLLEGNFLFEQPFPIGANGIATDGSKVYVGNTEASTLVGIRVADDGSAGDVSVLATYDVPPDGVAIDADGNIYATHPVGDLVTKRSPDGELTIIGVVDDGLDAPSSVDVGVNADGDPVAYVANFSIAVGRPLGHGPGIVAIDLR